ncbi:MAG: RNA polymerase sigma factor [Actinomycetota bacterium]|nr:RNA polymerase sigma factor [Actinomycetota bacterium]
MPRLDPLSLGQHLDALYRAAWALCGSREDAEDLVQDTLTRVLARPRTVQTGGDRAYLMSALRNTFASWLRTRSRRPRTVPEPDGFEAADPHSGRAPELATEIGELFAAVAALPEDFRLALAAVDMLGLSYGEAAAALGTSEATITTRIYRARRRVAAQLADTGAPDHAREGSGPDRSLRS